VAENSATVCFEMSTFRMLSFIPSRCCCHRRRCRRQTTNVQRPLPSPGQPSPSLLPSQSHSPQLITTALTSLSPAPFPAIVDAVIAPAAASTMQIPSTKLSLAAAIAAATAVVAALPLHSPQPSLSPSPSPPLSPSLQLGVVLENFPACKRREKNVSRTQEKLKKKKRHKVRFVPPPKSAISTFDDGGQYPPRIIIL